MNESSKTAPAVATPIESATAAVAPSPLSSSPPSVDVQQAIAKLQRLVSRLDDGDYGEDSEWREHADAARQAITALQGVPAVDLRRWVQHEAACRSRKAEPLDIGEWHHPHPCDCGLDTALQGLPEARVPPSADLQAVEAELRTEAAGFRHGYGDDCELAEKLIEWADRLSALQEGK